MIGNGKLTTKVVMAIVAVGAGALTVAQADMVYDEAAAPAATTTVTTTTVSTEPVVVDGSLKKASDKAKDKRGFQESMNNELVIQRLEEKRLKEEEKLTKEINKRFSLDDEATVGSAAPVAKEEVVIKPISESVAAPSSYQMAPAPQFQQSQVQPIQDSVKSSQSSLDSASISNNTSVSIAETSAPKAEGTRVGLTPRFGVATMSNSGGYEFNSRYLIGAGIIFDVTDHVAIEAGYQYAEFGMRLSALMNNQELVYRNNSIDMNMRLYLTGKDTAVRPYIGGGGAYSFGYLNYGRNTFMMAGNNLDYELTQFQGMLTGGLDFKLSKSISISAGYKFLRALSSTENESLNNAAFYIVNTDATKAAARGSIRDSDVHEILVGASFYF